VNIPLDFPTGKRDETRILPHGNAGARAKVNFLIRCVGEASTYQNLSFATATNAARLRNRQDVRARGENLTKPDIKHDTRARSECQNLIKPNIQTVRNPNVS
jgi:hypothetical protein